MTVLLKRQTLNHKRERKEKQHRIRETSVNKYKVVDLNIHISIITLLDQIKNILVVFSFCDIQLKH